MPDPGSAKGFDRYAYVNNNPINFNDPSGHGPCDGIYRPDSCDVQDYTEQNPFGFDDYFVDPLHDSLPLPPSEYTGFGDYRGTYTYDSLKSIWHVSIDRHGELGQNIYAVAPGTVVYAGWNSTGPGNFIVIMHQLKEATYFSVYFHLGRTQAENGINVDVGDRVSTSSVIGFLGDSFIGTKDKPCTEVATCTNPPHLHFEVRYANNVNLASEAASPLAGMRYWAFDSSWKNDFYDLGSIYGYYNNHGNPSLPE